MPSSARNRCQPRTLDSMRAALDALTPAMASPDSPRSRRAHSDDEGRDVGLGDERGVGDAPAGEVLDVASKIASVRRHRVDRAPALQRDVPHIAFNLARERNRHRAVDLPRELGHRLAPRASGVLGQHRRLEDAVVHAPGEHRIHSRVERDPLHDDVGLF